MTTVDDVLTLDADGVGPLSHPALIVALTGWFNAAGAATTALSYLTASGVTVGEIDPDPFYDFTQERPTIDIDGGDVRTITWPANTFRVVRTGGPHDLVVLKILTRYITEALGALAPKPLPHKVRKFAGDRATIGKGEILLTA